MKFLYSMAHLLYRFYTQIDTIIRDEQEGSMEIIWDVICLASAILFFGLTGVLVKALAKL